MHAPTVLAEAIELARKLDYHVREEYLEGAGGGHCTFGGRKWLLLDITQPTDVQLRDVADALRGEMQVWRHPVSSALAQMLHLTQTA